MLYETRLRVDRSTDGFRDEVDCVAQRVRSIWSVVHSSAETMELHWRLLIGTAYLYGMPLFFYMEETMEWSYIEDQLGKALKALENGNGFITITDCNGKITIEGSFDTSDSEGEELNIGDSVIISEEDSQYNLLLGRIYGYSEGRFLVTRTKNPETSYGWFTREELTKI